MVDRLTNLVAIFENPALDFSQNRAEGDDLLGDAYEYLMRHFATESGKSKGQFYTPAEVSRVMAKVIGIAHAQDERRHDRLRPDLRLRLAAAQGRTTRPGAPARSDALRAGEGRRHRRPGPHEHDPARLPDGATSGRATRWPTRKFKDGDGSSRPSTTSSPIRRSPTRRWSTGLDAAERPVPALRAAACRPPSRATTPTCCTSSARSRAPAKARASCRTACCSAAMPRPTSASSSSARGYIKGIIGLPANLFYGTGIPACIVVLDKENAARPQGHLHDRRQQGLHQGRHQEPPARAGHPQDRGHLHPAGRSARATRAWCRWPRSRPEERLQPQPAALHRQHRAGGPAGHRRPPARRHPRARHRRASTRYWQVLPGVRAALFESAGRPGYCAARSCRSAEIKAAIFGHAEFTAFNADVHARCSPTWQQANDAAPHRPRPGRPPQGADRDASPRTCWPPSQTAPLHRRLRRLSAPDGLLGRDDAGRRYLIAADGWVKRASRARSSRTRTRRARTKPDYRGQATLKSDLIPRRAARRPLLRRRAGRHRSARSRARRAIEQQLDEMARGARRRGRAAGRGRRTTRARSPSASVDGAAQGDQGRQGRRRRAHGARSIRSTCIEQEADAKAKRQGRAGGARRPRSTPSTPSSPRPRSRRWWWTTSGWPRLAAAVQGELDRVSQTLTGRIRATGRTLRHAAAAAHRAKWRRSPPEWTST
ncbi:MAG: SAM-dependent methyltransferase [Desulfomicrobium escambiense]|nr:SAM-dependent methyltransferase [Desulfomicrobium escambiense]